MDTSGRSDTLGKESLARELQERVKELNCLFGVSEIVERAGGSLEQIFAETADILPPSLEFPEIACARIVLGDTEFRSRGFRESPWKVETEILVHGEPTGSIQIYYAEEKPPHDEGPFSGEERRLLHAVAERLGHVVERLRTEEALREKEAELRARMTHMTRVSTMGEMASSIAHEVNQPLTAIATYAQACRRLMDADQTSEAEVKDVLRRISDEALRAGNIIHRLRSLVKRRASKLARCDLIQILEEVWPLALGDAHLHDVDVSLILPSSLPPILADQIHVQQVILNLTRNGIDAMETVPAGERKMEVRVEGIDDGQVQVSVEDRGVGLREESEAALFEPFFTTKEGGLGMGLSISRKLVAAHGGRLWFTRNPQSGTTFHFTIPFATEVDDE